MIVVSLNLKASYHTFADSRSLLENTSTPAVIVSTTIRAGPLPVQLADSVGYVDHIRSLSDHLIADSIPQRNA